MSRAGDTIRRDHPAARGFTLIELLVVLTVIALLATLATPMIQRAVPGVELKTAAEGLRTELRLARSAAISGNRETWLLIDVETGVYQRGSSARARTVPPAIRLTLLTARREQIDETQGRIRFFPDGTSTGGAVRLFSDARAYEVAVDWFDGRVSIDEAQEE
ncbi:MAG: GspH/FimT family pseudopilin [Alphaproteobacteria bacterium]